MRLFLDYIVVMARIKAMGFVQEEDGDVNIVSIVVLIGIAVLLAVFFRNHIVNLLNSLFSTINNAANSAMAPI
ncbi:MAG: flagellin-like protein [Lachnospiraceae bacterium]|nr:flagellin-like protein [Lachnospiraceae bacterium]